MCLNRKKIYHIWIGVLFLILPWVVFLAGYNPFSTAAAPGDGEIYGLQMQLFAKDFRMWNPFLAGGKSQLAEAGSQSLYLPAKIIMNLFPSYFGYNLLLLLHYSMAGYFTYRFIKIVNLKECSAVLGGIAFMFCGFMSAHKGHNTMVCVAAYLPVLLYFIEKYIVSEKRTIPVAAPLVWGLSVTADYTACSLYIAMVCFPYLVCRIISKDAGEKIKRMIAEIIKASITIFGIGTLLASYYLFPIIESLKYITRETITYDFFTGFSFPIKQIGMLLFPSLFGGGVSDIGYFGEWNITEIAGYMGLPVLIIAIACMIFAFKKNGFVRFWTVAACAGFLLVLGGNTPFYKLMYKVPVYNMFRVPARNWLEVNFCICILFAYGVDFIINEEHLFQKLYSIIRKTFFAAVVLEIGIFIFIRRFVLLSNIFQIGKESDSAIIQLLDQNVSMSSKSIYIYLIILLLTGICISFLKKYRKKTIFWMFTGALILTDLFPFAYFHDNIRTETYQSYPVEKHEISSTLNWIKEESKKDFRVWNLSDISGLKPVVNQNEGILAINSYGPVWLKNYSDLTRFNAAGELENVNWLIKNNQLLSMLNAKYIVVNADDSGVLEQSFLPQTDITDVNRISEWEQVQATVDRNRVILNAGDAGYSLIQYRIPKADHLYLRYTLSLETTPSQEGIYVDFYGADGSNITQKYHSSDEISRGTIKDSIVLNGSYSDIYLRIYSYSKSDIVIDACNFEEVQIPEGTYVRRFEDENGHAVYENTNAFGRAYFVSQVVTETDTQEQISMIQNAEVDLRNVALTESTLSDTNFQMGEVLDTDDQDNKITLEVNTEGDSFLVLTDNFYQGWEVYADGVQSEIYKVNGGQRGVLICEKGKHTIEFIYRPAGFYWGIAVSLFCVSILIIFTVRRKPLVFPGKNSLQRRDKVL